MKTKMEQMQEDLSKLYDFVLQNAPKDAQGAT